jgi:hypothetical protein
MAGAETPRAGVARKKEFFFPERKKQRTFNT